MALSGHSTYDEYVAQHAELHPDVAPLSADIWGGDAPASGSAASTSTDSAASTGTDSAEAANSVNADFRPPDYDEEVYGEWTDDQTNVYAAFKDVLGRDITSADLYSVSATFTGKSYDQIAKDLSRSDEAREKGVDATAYGNVVASVSFVPDDLKAYADEWKLQHEGQTLYEDDVTTTLRWNKDFGSVAVYQGVNDGTIIKGDYGETIVTQAAVDKYGADELVFTSYGIGDIIITPLDSGINLSNHGETKGGLELVADEEDSEGLAAWKQSYYDAGYQIFEAQGAKPTKGLGDYIGDGLESLGMSEDLANAVMAVGAPGLLSGRFLTDTLGIKEGYTIVDPLNFTTGLTFGSEGAYQNARGFANLADAVGFDGFDEDTDEDWYEKAGKGQAIGRTVVKAVVSIIAPWAGVALGAIDSVNQAHLGNTSWGSAIGNIATSVVSTYVGGAFGDFLGAGSYGTDLYGTAANMAAAGVGQAGANVLRTGLYAGISGEGANSEDYLMAAGTGLVSGAVGEGVKGLLNIDIPGLNRSVTGAGNRIVNGLTTAATSVGVAYANAELFENEGQTSEDLFLEAAIQGVQAGWGAYQSTGAQNRIVNGTDVINQERIDAGIDTAPVSSFTDEAVKSFTPEQKNQFYETGDLRHLADSSFVNPKNMTSYADADARAFSGLLPGGAEPRWGSTERRYTEQAPRRNRDTGQIDTGGLLNTSYRNVDEARPGFLQERGTTGLKDRLIGAAQVAYGMADAASLGVLPNRAHMASSGDRWAPVVSFEGGSETPDFIPYLYPEQDYPDFDDGLVWGHGAEQRAEAARQLYIAYSKRGLDEFGRMGEPVGANDSPGEGFDPNTQTDEGRPSYEQMQIPTGNLNALNAMAMTVDRLDNDGPLLDDKTGKPVLVGKPGEKKPVLDAGSTAVYPGLWNRWAHNGQTYVRPTNDADRAAVRPAIMDTYMERRRQEALRNKAAEKARHDKEELNRSILAFQKKHSQKHTRELEHRLFGSIRQNLLPSFTNNWNISLNHASP